MVDVATFSVDTDGKEKAGIEPGPGVHTGRNTIIKLSETKPDGITKEPSYKGKARYAVIHCGNGPLSSYVVAVDEPEQGRIPYLHR